MALVECSECGAQVSNKAKTCVKCGAPLVTKPTADDIRLGGQAFIGIVVLFVAFMVGLKVYTWQAERSDKAKSEQIAKERELVAATNCKRTPNELFPIGERYESSDLSRILDANFKQVDYSPSLQMRINCAGTIYVIQTAKVDDNKPTSKAQYRIMSIDVR